MKDTFQILSTLILILKTLQVGETHSIKCYTEEEFTVKLQ